MRGCEGANRCFSNGYIGKVASDEGISEDETSPSDDAGENGDDANEPRSGEIASPGTQCMCRARVSPKHFNSVNRIWHGRATIADITHGSDPVATVKTLPANVVATPAPDSASVNAFPPSEVTTVYTCPPSAVRNHEIVSVR